MRIRVRRVQSWRRGRKADRLLILGGAALTAFGVIVLVVAVLLALAPWLILIGLVAMAAGWIKRLLAGRKRSGRDIER